MPHHRPDTSAAVDPGRVEGVDGRLPRQGEGVLVGVAHRHRAPTAARSPGRADVGGRQAQRRARRRPLRAAADGLVDRGRGSSPGAFHHGPCGTRPPSRAVPTKLRWISTVPAPMHRPRMSR